MTHTCSPVQRTKHGIVGEPGRLLTPTRGSATGSGPRDGQAGAGRAPRRHTCCVSEAPSWPQARHGEPRLCEASDACHLESLTRTCPRRSGAGACALQCTRLTVPQSRAASDCFTLDSRRQADCGLAFREQCPPQLHATAMPGAVPACRATVHVTSNRYAGDTDGDRVAVSTEPQQHCPRSPVTLLCCERDNPT